MAVIYLCCLVGIVFYVCHKSMTQNGLIDIDEAEPIEFSYLIDINDAPWPAIANLPGIGQTLAQEIVRYRQDNGPFERLEQITEIRGIGPAKLEQIREFIQPIESTPTGSK